jgi:peptide chain release factor subunit 1
MAPTASRSSSRTQRPGTPAHRHAGTDIQQALQELLALGTDRGWVVSCYQKLEPGDRAGEKYRIKLKNRLRQAEQRLGVLGFAHGERETVSANLARIEAFFAHTPNLAGARGVAVFAANGFFRVVRLPYVLRSRIIVDRTAVVGELVALAETGTRLLVAVADRRAARLFDVGLDRVEELEGLIAPDATRSGRFRPDRDAAPGAGEFRYHNRIREEKHRHLARVADALARAWRSRPFDGVVVGGVGTDAAALVPHLDPAVQGKVLGTLHLPPKGVNPGDLREQALAFLAESAEVAAAEAVGEVSGLVASGWAINGVEPTLRALARGQVRTLIVDHDAVIPGYRMRTSCRLATVPSGTRAEGEPVPVADLLDDAIEEALRQRARVLVVRGPMARRIDRLAGILRFRASR